MHVLPAATSIRRSESLAAVDENKILRDLTHVVRNHFGVDNPDDLYCQTPRTGNTVRQNVPWIGGESHDDWVSAASLKETLLERCADIIQHRHLGL
jgi:hypothetical protein